MENLKMCNQAFKAASAKFFDEVQLFEFSKKCFDD